MAVAMKVEIIKTETIKPSSPTPVDLKSFRLSFLDQIAPAAYIPLVLFYPVDGDTVDHNFKATERSDRVKKSLSETLIRFYILAGRVKDNSSIECNDAGVDFIEGRVNCLLSDILKPPNAEVLKNFLPIEIEYSEAGTGRLLLVQATYFECGGMAIGLSMSHKVADASTLSAFIKSWSATALGTGKAALPLFIGASLLPPVDFSFTMPAVELAQHECVTRRLVFDASKISVLKAKTASESVQQPTRVEAVTALIWKCAMTSSRSNSRFPKPSILCHTVNLRKRIEPPLPENSIGNLLSCYTAQMVEKGVELQGLVGQLRKEIREFSENDVKKLQVNDGFSVICEAAKELVSLSKRDDIDFYSFTSWCKFQLYEADFGWGKPSWVSIASSTFSNVVVLMDTKNGGGIEAWLTLSEEDTALFERNEELLAFASLNPSVL